MGEVAGVKFLSSLVGSQQRMPKTDRGKKSRNISILFRPMEINIPEESARSWKCLPGARGVGILLILIILVGLTVYTCATLIKLSN